MTLWDEVGEVAAGADRGDRLWQAAELATGTVGNQRAAELARLAFGFGAPARGEAWGHERLGRYLWATGRLEESAVEYEQAAALLTGADRDPGSAPVRAGLAQAALMAHDLGAADRWCQDVFALVADADADPGAWATSCRVLGAVRSARGDPAEAVRLSREAVAAADTPHAEALATMYLCLALLDLGSYEEAVASAAAGQAFVQRVGLDHSFGGYVDALAVDGLIRLGRWSEADGLLARHVDRDPLPAGALRLGGVRAVLAARRGQGEEAEQWLTEAARPPVDGFHRAHLDLATAEAHLALGAWARAAVASERGRDDQAAGASSWAGRFARCHAVASVELALDARSEGQDVDLASVADRLRDLVVPPVGPGEPSLEAAADHAHALAAISRLTGPDPEAWAEAARRWTQLADPWQTAVARRHEAEAAVATGDLARASTALREAHATADGLGAAPLLAEITALAARTRLSLDEPTSVALDGGSVERLGLTPREAEVLALVASGRTNREIGTELYISEKTASVHVSNILRKLDVSGRQEAARIAHRHGLGRAGTGPRPT